MTDHQFPWASTIQEDLALEARHILRDVVRQFDLAPTGHIRISGYAHGAPDYFSIESDDPWVKRRTDVANMLKVRGVLRSAEPRYIGGPHVSASDTGYWLFVEGDEQTVRDALKALEDRFNLKPPRPADEVTGRQPNSEPPPTPIQEQASPPGAGDKPRDDLVKQIIAGVAILVIGGLLSFFFTPVGDWIKANWFQKPTKPDGDSPTTLVADLMEDAQRARWSNGHRALAWPGSKEDTVGYARWVDNAWLEDGTQRPRVLQTHPEFTPEGRIMGEYSLSQPLRAGDVFRSEVGFLRNWSGQVEFIVETFGGDHPGERTVARMWDSGEDRQVKKLVYDLTASEGDRVIRLVVRAGQQSFEDWAVWIRPRIEHR